MSVIASIMGRLPHADQNGLATAAPEILADPRPVTAIVVLRPKKIETDLDADSDTKVKFEIVHVEIVGGSDEQFVLSTLRGVCERRTGVQMMDGFEEALRSGIQLGADLRTGELPEDHDGETDGDTDQ